MKTVVVTGANRGLGLGFVKHYLAQGWQVFALSRGGLNDVGIEGDNGNNLNCLQVDLSDEKSIQQVAEDITKQAKSIDLLINNAGVAEHECFGEWTQKALMNNYLINTVAPALLSQALSSQMKEGSQVIQLSSGLASIENSEGLNDSYDGYSMSKAAINMLSRRLATTLSARNIMVNAISPGWVQTDMGGKEAPTSVQEAVNRVTNTINTLTLDRNGLFLDEFGEPIKW